MRSRKGASVIGRAICILVVLVAFAAPAPALANHGTLPWDGGQSVTTAFEATAAGVLSELINIPGRIVHCHGETDWTALASQGGFDPSDVWGYVEFRISWDELYFGPVAYTHISQQACWYADEFAAAADKRSQKWCDGGTTTEWQTEYREKVVKKRVRVRKNGKWTWKIVRKTISVEVDVPYEIPIEKVCDDWISKLFAINTFAHEGMHLAGVRSEARAECYAVQNLAWTAWKLLGVEWAFAVEMASDYWTMYYLEQRPGSSYYSSECRDGGSLDLRPESTTWPSG